MAGQIAQAIVLLLSLSLGGGTCAFAADAPEGEPGPAAVPLIPDLNNPPVPEQPPLEPQGPPWKKFFS